MQERENPTRDLETYMMHRQFSYRTLLAHGLLHNLNFQLWDEANQIVNPGMNYQPSPSLRNTWGGNASYRLQAMCCAWCVRFDHTETLRCLQDKKRLVSSC